MRILILTLDHFRSFFVGVRNSDTVLLKFVDTLSAVFILSSKQINGLSIIVQFQV